MYYLQNNADGTVTERVKTAPLIVMNPDTEAYQTVSKVIRPSELVQDLTVTRVRMTLLYAYNRNHAVFSFALSSLWMKPVSIIIITTQVN